MPRAHMLIFSNTKMSQISDEKEKYLGEKGQNEKSKLSLKKKNSKLIIYVVATGCILVLLIVFLIIFIFIGRRVEKKPKIVPKEPQLVSKGSQPVLKEPQPVSKVPFKVDVSTIPKFNSSTSLPLETVLTGQPYHVVLESATLNKLRTYQKAVKEAFLQKGTAITTVDEQILDTGYSVDYESLIPTQIIPGNFFRESALSKIPINSVIESPDHMVQGLFLARRSNVGYAKHYNWRSRWNDQEASLLGDMSVVLKAMVIDDGQWVNEKGEILHKIHPEQFPVTMAFISGCLGMPNFPDKLEFDQGNLKELITRRLLPVLRSFSQQLLLEEGPFARGIVTMNGLGCSAYAHEIPSKQANIEFLAAVRHVHRTYGHQFSNLDIWLDLFDKFFSQEPQDNITVDEKNKSKPSLFLRSLKDPKSPGLPQLLPFVDYAAYIKRVYGLTRVYSRLFTIVAWDHYAWPGNDWVGGSRTTDDGNKGAATTCMHSMTGIEGSTYDGLGYQPPKEYTSWMDLIEKMGLIVHTLGRTIIYDRNVDGPGQLLRNLK